MRIAHKVNIILIAAALMLLLLLVPRHGHGQSVQDFGDYIVHYSAISTQQLPADAAAQYGIARAGDRGLLNIAVEPKHGDAAMVRADIRATVSDLTGHSQPVRFHETNENGAFDYLGEFPLNGSGSYLFTVSVTPPGAAHAYVVKFNRDYVVD
jgi:hypothetical protein